MNNANFKFNNNGMVLAILVASVSMTISASAEQVLAPSTLSAASTSSAATLPAETVVLSPAVSEPVSIASADSVAPAANEAAVEEMQKQPVTVIEASPLSLSKAEELRKLREQTEVETEQKLVEKLEQARMEDEKKRQSSILGSISQEKAAAEKQAEPKVEVVAPVAVAPVVVAPVVEAPKSTTIEDVRNAVHEELSAVKAENEKAAAVIAPRNFVSATIGMLDYGSASIQTIGAAEFTFGKMFDERWAIEFGVGANNAYVDDSAYLYRKMTQYNVGVGTRFMILTGRVRPSVGFRVDYVNRDYSDFRDMATGAVYPTDQLKSWAINYGLMAGIDFSLSQNLTLGAEYRFSSNLTYQYNQDYLNTANYRNYVNGQWNLENSDSDFIGFTAKYLF
jgi:opacity protein-like surface antigen